jgi:hypothetical protein
MRVLWFLPLAFLLSACAPTMKEYEGTQPTMDFFKFFNGKVDGWGAVYDWRGKLTSRYHVLMDGTLKPDGTLRIDETFTYDDDRIWLRYWDVAKNPDGTYTGTSAEVPGVATGKTAGHAINFKYPFALPTSKNPDGTFNTIHLNLNDWMWLIDDYTLINRTKLTKFGLPVGEVVMFFRRRDAENRGLGFDLISNPKAFVE